MTYRKLISTAVPESTDPLLVLEATSDVIISKIYIHNPNGNNDARTEVFFVDSNNSNEFDASTGTINEENTKALDVVIPGLDTLEFGNGLTFTTGERIYVRTTNASVIVHVFGKIV